MAVIQKIRDKYAKLAGGVIVLALVGFVLMDFGKGGASRSTTVGKINGKKIDYTEYEEKIRLRENQMKAQNPNAPLDENTQAQMRDQVWQQMVKDELMKDIYEKLGIVVGKSELNDLLTGPRPDPSIQQAFTNPETGVFNPQEVAARIQQLRKDPQMKDQWAAFEADLIERRYASKFNSLLSGGIYIPKFVLDDQNTSRNTTASINYVKLPYTLVPDDQAKVTDEEIRKYMQDHKAMFEVKKPFRSASFVSFNIVPSTNDSTRVLSELERIKPEFETTTDVETFVNRNSENPMPAAYFTKEQLQSLPDVESIFSAPVQSVVGPIYDGNGYILAKIEERKSLPDSIKCRHILVKTEDRGAATLSDTAAKARLDSAVAQLKSGMPFDSVVVNFSDDYQPEAGKTSGEYEFTLAQRQQISKEFGDFVFEGQNGTNKIVKVQNDNYAGYHYIEILNQAAPAPVVKIAFVTKELAADNNTYNEIFAKANQFSTQAKTATQFDKVAEAQGQTITPAEGIDENSYLVNGLGSAKEMVKWVYEAKEGDVSPVFTLADKFVIAKLTGITPAGLVPINEQNRPQLEAMVKKGKKARILMDKTKGKTSLEAIAQAEQQQVGTAESVNFLQGFVPGLGNEPKVSGYSFCKTFKENTLSPAIPGAEGVYYIKVNSRTAAPETAPRDLTMERRMMEYSLKGNAANQIVNGLTESATIKDTRAKIYQ